MAFSVTFAKIERFTQGVDLAVFEEDDRVAYAVKYALLRILSRDLSLDSHGAVLLRIVVYRRGPLHEKV